MLTFIQMDAETGQRRWNMTNTYKLHFFFFFYLTAFPWLGDLVSLTIIKYASNKHRQYWVCFIGLSLCYRCSMGDDSYSAFPLWSRSLGTFAVAANVCIGSWWKCIGCICQATEGFVLLDIGMVNIIKKEILEGEMKHNSQLYYLWKIMMDSNVFASVCVHMSVTKVFKQPLDNFFKWNL